MLTHNIDLSTWLDKAADKEAEIQGEQHRKRIAAAAQATEIFGDDELEEHAEKMRRRG